MDYIKYAIDLGHDPTAPSFNYIVEKIKDLDAYIKGRKIDLKDSMYVSPGQTK